MTEIEGDEFVVRYCDWPDEPPLTRSREQIALLHPAREVLPPHEPTKAEPMPVTRSITAKDPEHLSDEDLQPANAA